jgi:methionyl-tRNA synthetase
MSRRTLFVTTALPYANGPFHIGHIMEYIQADIWVRFQRMQGHTVHFVCADDAHGAPIMLRAEAEGVTPHELVAKIAATRPKDLNGFHISYDHWGSTDSPANTALLQDIYFKLKKAGLIYAKPVEQFFDPVKAMFLPDRYIKGECPKCGTKDQYGDACENCSSVYSPTDLINPYSTLSLHSCRNGPARTRTATPVCSRKSSTRRRSGWARMARASPTGIFHVTPRTSAFRFPTSLASIFTSGSTRLSAIWLA